MNREQLIAHLELHGWQPVREVPSAFSGYGIYHPRDQYGFRVIGLNSTNEYVRKLDTNRIEPTKWEMLNDHVLERCANAVDTWVEAP